MIVYASKGNKFVAAKNYCKREGKKSEPKEIQNIFCDTSFFFGKFKALAKETKNCWCRLKKKRKVQYGGRGGKSGVFGGFLMILRGFLRLRHQLNENVALNAESNSIIK